MSRIQFPQRAHGSQAYALSENLDADSAIDTVTSRQLRAISDELDYALIAVAMSASIATACAFLKTLAAPYKASHYAPADPRVSSPLAMALTTPPISPLTLARLGDFHKLSEAATAMSRQIEQREELRRTRNDPAWMSASSLWRRCAAVGLLLMDGQPVLQDFGRSSHSDRSAALRSLLAAAADGQTPCLTEAGELIFPSWAERRLDARRPLGLAADLNGPRQTKSIVIRDISETGMGLDAVGKIEPGEYVSVTLPTGRVIGGTVVWQRDGRTGIRLADPLSPNDPLLTNSLTW